MDLIVVPFLLAAHVPPNTDLPPMYLESTFNVHVNSKFTIVNGNTADFFLSHFTSKLICNATASNKLSCYIKKPTLKVTKTSTLEETTNYVPFDYINSAPVEVIFSTYGIANYNVAEDAYTSSYFLGLFLMITTQMSIGNFEKKGHGPIHGLDINYIGSCPTNYTVNYRFEVSNFTTSKYKFNLKSISPLGLEDNQAILIKKQRSLDKCHYLNDYMFGIRHIKPSCPVHHKMIESASRIEISIQHFDSTTDNRYKLYNQDENEIGSAIESIHLQLDSM